MEGFYTIIVGICAVLGTMAWGPAGILFGALIGVVLCTLCWCLLWWLIYFRKH